ncbi:MAG TPA: S26 family signal peptidase [Mycobacteriales bacterium]
MTATARARTRSEPSGPSRVGQRPPDRPTRWAPALCSLLVALFLALLLAVGWVSGWRAQDLTSASMGTAAPVGTLVISRPIAPSQIRVGDIVAFHPPGQPHTTFVHRVVAIHHPGPAAQLSTHGDLSGSVDPWTLPATAVIGTAAVRIPAVGWLLRMLPWLTLGAGSVLALSVPFGNEGRRAAQIAGFSLITVVAVWHFHPLTGIETISSGPTRHGAQATVVATGILPVKVTALHHAAGASLLQAGHIGTVRATALDSRGAMSLAVTPHLTGWWWLTALAWPAPLLAGLRQPRPTDPEPAPEHVST